MQRAERRIARRHLIGVALALVIMLASASLVACWNPFMATPISHFGDGVSTRAGSVEYSLAYAWSAGTGENNSYLYAIVIRSYNHSDEPAEMPIIHAIGPSDVALNIVNEEMATEAGVRACRSKLVLDEVSSGILDPGVNEDCLLVFELEAPISDTDTVFAIFEYDASVGPASLPVPGTEFTSNEGLSLGVLRASDGQAKSLPVDTGQQAEPTSTTVPLSYYQPITTSTDAISLSIAELNSGTEVTTSTAKLITKRTFEQWKCQRTSTDQDQTPLWLVGVEFEGLTEGEALGIYSPIGSTNQVDGMFFLWNASTGRLSQAGVFLPEYSHMNVATISQLSDESLSISGPSTYETPDTEAHPTPVE